MKNSTTIFAIAFALMLALVSCNQEPQEKLTVDLQTDFEKFIIAKMGAKEGALILEQMYNATTNDMRAPIDYNGELCPGVVNSGTSTDNLCCIPEDGGLWYFSADEGDVVNIEINRTNCEMNPLIILYDVYGDYTELTFDNIVAFATSNVVSTCIADCTPTEWGDALLTGIMLPITGVYTLGVWDSGSINCSGFPLTYDVVVTGQNPCDIIIVNDIVIDGCETGVANQTLADGTTMQDNIDACAATVSNHGAFVRCVAHLTNDWIVAGLITESEEDAIQQCAAQSSIP